MTDSMPFWFALLAAIAVTGAGVGLYLFFAWITIQGTPEAGIDGTYELAWADDLGVETEWLVARGEVRTRREARPPGPSLRRTVTSSPGGSVAAGASGSP